MQVKFSDLNSSATKFTQRGSSAAGEYAKNATAAAAEWATNTAASEENYNDGVRSAIARGEFGKGVARAGAAKYAGQIAAVAGPRFSDGISKAGPAWTKGFGAIASRVAGTDIGPRGPRGSVQNKQRAATMADAFRAAKLAS